MSSHHADLPLSIDELVYGSAKELLSSTASDLGVIASTPDFPSALARELSGRRSACPLAGEMSERNARCFLGRAGEYLEVSRVEPGLDHTGRSVTFAHHLVCRSERGGLADGAAWQVLAKLWAESRAPQGFNAGYLAQKQVDTRAVVCPRLPVDESLFIQLVAESLAAAEAGDRTVVVLPGGCDVLATGVDLVVWLFLALPAGLHDKVFAAVNVADDTEWNPDVSLYITAEGDPFCSQAKERASAGRGVRVIDLSRGGAVARGAESLSPFAAATRLDLRAGAAGRFARLCEKHDVGPREYGAFGTFVALLESFQSAPSVGSLESLHRSLVPDSAAPPSQWAEELYVEVVGNVLRKHAASILEDLQNTGNGAGRLAACLQGHESLIHIMGRLGVLAEGKKLFAKALAVAEVLLQCGDDAIAQAVSGRREPGMQAYVEKYLTRKEAPVEFDEQPQVTGWHVRPMPSGPMVSQMPPVHAGMSTAGGSRGYRHASRKPSGSVNLIPPMAVLLCIAACAFPFAWESFRGGVPALGGPEAPPSPSAGPDVAQPDVDQVDSSASSEPPAGSREVDAGERTAATETRKGAVGTVLEEHFIALVIAVASLVSVISLTAFYSPLSTLLGTRVAPSATLLAPLVLMTLVVGSWATTLLSIYSTRAPQQQVEVDPENAPPSDGDDVTKKPASEDADATRESPSING